MKRLLLLLVWAFVPIVAASALAQTGDGYVGVYRDSLGTQACASVPPMTSATLYVIAKTSGASVAGITGAEFRIEVTSPAGWLLSYTAPTIARLALGDPIDTSSDSNDTSGLNVSFTSCVSPIDGNIALGTISVFNLAGSTTTLLVKEHNRPTNPGYACALFTVCDDPVFTKSCMDASPDSPCSVEKAGALQAPDGAVFTAELNADDPSGAIDIGTADRQVLALFEPGIVQLPAGQTAASLSAVTIASSSLNSILQSHGATALAMAFPSPGSAPSGLADLYRIVLPDVTNRDALVEALQSVDGIVSADKNGGAAGSAAFESDDAEKPATGNQPGIGDPNRLATTCVFGPPLYGCTYTAVECANDPFIGDQWPIFNVRASGIGGVCNEDMNVDVAWATTKGSGITIELMGSGIHQGLYDLQGRIEGDAGDGGDTPSAGIIVANADNASGTAGLNWYARVREHDIADATGGATDDVAIASALDQANSSGNRIVLNLFRLVDTAGAHRWSTAVRILMRNLYMNNKLLIGHMGGVPFISPNPPSVPLGDEFPAGFRTGFFTVGATTPDGWPWFHGKRGAQMDVSAPGNNIVSTGSPALPIGYYSGTTLAAAEATGVASLLLAARSDLAADDIMEIMQRTAADKGDAGQDDHYGWGRVDAGAAMARLKSPYRLYHLTASGSTTTISHGVDRREWAVPPAPGFPVGVYPVVEKVEVRKDVVLPTSFVGNPWVWGRGHLTVGYEPFAEPDVKRYAFGFCDAVDVTPSTATLRTYIYIWRNPRTQAPEGYFPCEPSQVQFAYTVLGRLQTTDTEGPEASAASEIQFAVASGIGGKHARLLVAVPAQMNADLRLFDVRGAHVATLFAGSLRPGQREFEWSGLLPNGEMARSGVYFARLVAGEKRESRKFILVR